MMEKGAIINNRYEILSRVGAGGMSNVYKAKDHKLNRNVAIKVLKREYSNDKNFVSKFRVEAQSAASLIHPNIVNVYDVGQDEGLYYIVMELIEGITLKRYIEKKGRLSVKETISIGIQIANGIECAHNNQIVHRDIKPQNIMISREGKVKVTDFGIAKAASANTISGSAMGSVHYISPEQASGKTVGEKSDIYSFGVTMFEMLTGKVPFDGDTTVTIALQHIQNHVPSIREYLPDVPVSIEKIILKCTQNRTDYRYPKISSVIADLKRALVEPDVDFVQLETADDTTSTIMITDDEINQIKKDSDGTFKEEILDEPEKKEDDDIDKVSPKAEKMLTIGGVILGIVALVIVAVILTAIFSGRSVKIPSGNDSEVATIDPKKTEVPNVVGLSCDEAEKELHDKNLGYEYDSDYQFSDEYPADTIISQSENAGKVIKKNTTVSLTVSKGPERITIPTTILDSSLESATAKLEDMGLKCKIIYEYSSKTIGTVIAVSPNEKASVVKKDTVSLTISRGTKDTGVNVLTVPNLINLTEAKAQAKISSSGFDVGEVRYEFSNDIKKGIVLRQTMRSGDSALGGAKIGLVVSKGSEMDLKYEGNYTFAREDILDASGNPIKSGKVTVYLNGEKQKVPSSYSKLETWTGDFAMKFTGDAAGKATVELQVDGVVAITDTVKLKKVEVPKKTSAINSKKTKNN